LPVILSIRVFHTSARAGCDDRKFSPWQIMHVLSAISRPRPGGYTLS
jgi:hypothetical protein